MDCNHHQPLKHLQAHTLPHNSVGMAFSIHGRSSNAIYHQLLRFSWTSEVPESYAFFWGEGPCCGLVGELSKLSSCNSYLHTGTPQLPLKIPQILSNRGHQALGRGTLGGVGIPGPSKMSKIMAQYPKTESLCSIAQKSAPYAAILSSFGYWAIILATLEVQVFQRLATCWCPSGKRLPGASESSGFDWPPLRRRHPEGPWCPRTCTFSRGS